jgi:fatty acid desaturase
MKPETAARIRRIREALPPEAFQPNPRRLWMIGGHAAVIAAAYWWIRMSPVTAPLASVVIGHSLACFGFVAHEMSHNAVVRQPRLKYALLMLTFGLNFISPTMWNRLHNDAHHGHTGTPEDPDRPFLVSERQPSTAWYARLFYPSRTSLRSVLVFCHFVSYLLRNMAGVFYPEGAKPAIMTSKPAYRAHERAWIAAEIVWMLVLQYGVFVAVGQTWWAFTWASLVPLCIASAVIMAYVFTQHFLNPIEHDHDPIGGTTSLVVSPLVDWLHCNFSFHTEHHVFPTMNSEYYPLVSQALREHAGESYSRIAAQDAWRQLWRTDAFRKVGS